MKKTMRLSAIAICLISSGFSTAVFTASGGAPSSTPTTRLYVVPADSSLYQLALQSGITVAELRTLNNGGLNRREAMKAGESLLLPADSPLLPIRDESGLYVNNLPELGMGNDPLPKADKDGRMPASAMEMKAAGMAQSVGGQDWNNMTGDQVQNQAESWAKNKAKAEVLNPVQQQAQDLLGKFGKARVTLTVDDNGDLSKSSASLFTPWYENDDVVTFSQVGVHDQDGRTIGNFGLGVRWEQETWLLGTNTFLDQDFSRNHSRLGLGLELWADYTKLATNYYHPLSGWKDSKDFDDYLERPAEGFDVRAQGYLPVYPHLGASLVYEQYYGDEVALFGKDNLQEDPHAVTLGLDYTPFPLATIKVSHKEGQDGQDESQVDLQVNYQLGTALDKQLDPDNVGAMRTLRGSRYDMVDRNYDIVLEYKEKSGLLEVDLAAVPATLLEGDTHLMQPLVKNKYRITSVTWNGDTVPLAILPTGGVNNPQGWQITLPAWRSGPGDINHYQLSVTVADEKGRQQTSNPVDIVVGQQRQGLLALESAASVPATGLPTDVIKLSAHLEDHQSQAVNDPLVTPVWKVTDAVTGAVVPVVAVGGSCPLDAASQPLPCLQVLRAPMDVRTGINYYVEELVSTLSGSFIVRADLGVYGMSNPQTVTFASASSTNLVVRAEIQDPAGQDLLTTGAHPQVGVTYTVKLFDAANVDITTSIPAANVQWELDGTNTAGCSVTLNSSDTLVRGYQFTPRTNANSTSGVPCGDQGFGLKVTYVP
ncbi:inverse autotransporter beta domain-containing protein [Budvicia aquatica]|uniref:Invasin n=2 Tax=Budvicia aquatica TaxID=82979 RepID=A0A2C6C6P9_9GAMM|nr:inverse autotransporter beta domain-containing protein [Budvicia aquatica]PHI28268.1 murein transglycosylase [Budvicia aquatica]PHI32020.1 murein transglycosylase [Budvicia aquatica]VFS46152.1 Invasin [Budvicia aquatica]